MIARMVTLAAETSSVDVVGVILWSVVLLALLIAGMAFALRLKRRMKAEDGDAAAPVAGFTLSDLRQMHRTGQLSDAEFERAKEKVVAAAKKAAERAQVPGAPVERDSPDAIRARRLAREQPGNEGVDGDGASR